MARSARTKSFITLAQVRIHRGCMAQQHAAKDGYREHRTVGARCGVGSSAEAKDPVAVLTAREPSAEMSKSMTRRAEALLGQYSWPGNGRELENTIGYGCMMHRLDACRY